MKAFITKMVPIKTTDRFSFRCSQCGACCRRVRESVPLESLDAFRLAKFFRDSGEKVRSIDDVLAAYAEPVLLHESGYLVFMLKTVGEDDACIFLKENKCTIHSVNPRACRTYPISVGPDAKGGYEQFISMEQPHHNTGRKCRSKSGYRSGARIRILHSGKKSTVRCKRLQGYLKKCRNVISREQ